MEPLLTTSRLFLRTPKDSDFIALKQFEDRNRKHLGKWETIIEPENDLQYDENLKNKLEIWKKECEEGKSLRIFLFNKVNPDQLIGFCNFTQICRGPFMACYLGYKIDYEYEGKGLMFEALESSIRYVFEELALNRIMANYMPINKRSESLLHSLGFIVEGHAKHYLLINGQWEDHVLTALTLEEWKKYQTNLPTS